MHNQQFFENDGQYFDGPAGKMWATNLTGARQAVIGAILIVALLAFEVFNFDTTRYALSNLLGDVAFLGVRWAAILAVAFCAIDFAGLAHLFTPESGRDEPSVVWYLMGAWLLGATMNAVMTWWAVNLTLLSHSSFGNEVLNREQLLQLVPPFVAALVWLTRILFIGAFAVAGDQFFRQQQPSGQHTVKAATAGPRRPATVQQPAAPPVREPTNNRVRHRPPAPAATRPVPTMSARSRERDRS